jgi:hypothetical protein
MQNLYGILDSNDCHIDTSLTERGAKNYATRHGYNSVSVRFNAGYHVEVIAVKINNKWTKV